MVLTRCLKPAARFSLWGTCQPFAFLNTSLIASQGKKKNKITHSLTKAIPL